MRSRGTFNGRLMAAGAALLLLSACNMSGRPDTQEAMDVAEIDGAKVATDLKDAEEDLRDANDEHKRHDAERKVARLRALAAAAQ